jgi:hypothetical protein
MEDNNNHSGDNNEHININKHNNDMAEINKYRLRYTELIDEETERDGEMIIETKNIEYSLERLMTSKHIIKMDTKQLNIIKQ